MIDPNDPCVTSRCCPLWHAPSAHLLSVRVIFGEMCFTIQVKIFASHYRNRDFPLVNWSKTVLAWFLWVSVFCVCGGLPCIMNTGIRIESFHKRKRTSTVRVLYCAAAAVTALGKQAQLEFMADFHPPTLHKYPTRWKKQ